MTQLKVKCCHNDFKKRKGKGNRVVRREGDAMGKGGDTENLLIQGFKKQNVPM